MSLIFFIISLCPLAAQTQTGIHTLETGDTLYMISRKYGIPLTVLRNVNQITDEKKLRTGLSLVIPEAYKVEPGDTLYSLGRKFKSTPAELENWNSLTGSLLKPGQIIFTPPTKRASEHVPSSVPTIVTSRVTLSPTEVEKPKTEVHYPLKGGSRATETPVKGIIFSIEKTDFISVDDGTVIFSGRYREWGNLLLVDNGSGRVYGYSGFQNPKVGLGMVVKRGQILGETNESTKELLFFLYENGTPAALSPTNP